VSSPGVLSFWIVDMRFLLSISLAAAAAGDVVVARAVIYTEDGKMITHSDMLAMQDCSKVHVHVCSS
jgi:hypothetical protein